MHAHELADTIVVPTTGIRFVFRLNSTRKQTAFDMRSWVYLLGEKALISDSLPFGARR